MSLTARITRKVQSLQWKLKNRLHALLLPRLDLELLLTTGVRVKVKSLADWVIYTNIFADDEYDAAIAAACARKTPGGPLQILDIGANVGFFALRVAHVLSRVDKPMDFRLTCIEGCPSVYAQLVERLGDSPALKDRYRTVHALAGQLSGSARIVDSAFHAMTSLARNGSGAGVEVPFVDLHTLVAPNQMIDLLKCDIEGSEGALLQNYGDLLERTRVAIFEFHFDKIDRAACQRRLQDLGFGPGRVLQEDKHTSLEFFERPASAR